MSECIRSRVRHFTDETIVCLTIKSDADSENLQEVINKLAIWKEKWPFIPINAMYQQFQEKSNPVKSAKCLGCTISSDLKSNEHIRNICN